MDAAGARILAARLQARCRPDTRIELISDSTPDSPVRPGDRGTVYALRDGLVVVEWDKGFTTEIDPALATYRPLGVGTPQAA